MEHRSSIVDATSAVTRIGTAPLTNEKIEIASLSKTFSSRRGPVQALQNTSLSIPEGQFCCIVGPSGCGKTTLLRILAGLEDPETGRIVLHHRDRAKPLNSMVFQEQSIFPWLTVEQNIAYGLRMRRVDRATTNERVQYYLKQTGLSRFARAFPHQLSGGMKQRVSVARAFANDPEILLMDEPFASLDEQNKVMLQEELLRIWSASQKTVVFITHSIDEALVLGDRVVVMTAHPGRIKADIPVDLPRPRHVYELKANPKFGQLVNRASLTRAVIGFVIGAVPAVIIGMSMGLFRLVRAAVWPVVGALFPEMRHRQPSAATRVIGSSSRGTLGAADQQHGNTLTDSLELQLVATRARAMLWALQHVRTGNRHLPIEEVKPRCSAERWTARSPNTKGTK